MTSTKRLSCPSQLIQICESRFFVFLFFSFWGEEKKRRKGKKKKKRKQKNKKTKKQKNKKKNKKKKNKKTKKQKNKKKKKTQKKTKKKTKLSFKIHLKRIRPHGRNTMNIIRFYITQNEDQFCCKTYRCEWYRDHHPLFFVFNLFCFVLFCFLFCFIFLLCFIYSQKTKTKNKNKKQKQKTNLQKANLTINNSITKRSNRSQHPPKIQAKSQKTNTKTNTKNKHKNKHKKQTKNKKTNLQKANLGSRHMLRHITINNSITRRSNRSQHPPKITCKS